MLFQIRDKLDSIFNLDDPVVFFKRVVSAKIKIMWLFLYMKSLNYRVILFYIFQLYRADHEDFIHGLTLAARVVSLCLCHSLHHKSSSSIS